ncbi:MAG: helix-turn-helix transcriptional regulator [Maritimibacter sp.]|nr:helix-turn-helix transcriptional regulator [Maritimibacter sp.]
MVTICHQMDDKWFKAQQKRVGVTADQIAAEMGRDRSAVSSIYTGRRRMSLEWARAFAKVLDVPLEDVLSHAGVLEPEDAQRVRPGFAESDVAPWIGKGSQAEHVKTAAASLGGARPGVDVWTVKSLAMAAGGYLPGDQLLVDTHQSERCKAGDVVIAQRYDGQNGTAETVLRRFEPPVLVAASTDPEEGRVLVVDGHNVVIRGKVVASWRA